MSLCALNSRELCFSAVQGRDGMDGTMVPIFDRKWRTGQSECGHCHVIAKSFISDRCDNRPLCSSELPKEAEISNLSRTRSEAFNLLSIARLNSRRSRAVSKISRRTRIDQTRLGQALLSTIGPATLACSTGWLRALAERSLGAPIKSGRIPDFCRRAPWPRRQQARVHPKATCSASGVLAG